jgi:hypothetical protein
MKSHSGKDLRGDRKYLRRFLGTYPRVAGNPQQSSEAITLATDGKRKPWGCCGRKKKHVLPGTGMSEDDADQELRCPRPIGDIPKQPENRDLLEAHSKMSPGL